MISKGLLPVRTAALPISIKNELNSLGYRAKEIDEINWNNSIALFGCSATFGVGLEYQETISSKLSSMLDLPVVNLGAPATSMMFSLLNQIYLAEQNIKPLAIVNLWTSIERQIYFVDDNFVNLGPWTQGNDKSVLRVKEFHEQWLSLRDNLNSNALYIQRISQLLWKDAKHYQASFFDHTAKLLNIPCFTIQDKAKDNSHPGPTTANFVAKQIADWYSK